MTRMFLAAGAAVLLVGCGSEQAAAPVKAEKLTPGHYEVQATVASFRSTDGNTPQVQAKQGEVVTTQACVGADGVPPPELFAAKGDQCTVQSPYVRGGRMNLTIDCNRPGTDGKIMTEVNGSFTADSLDGSVSTTSFIQGPGDYELKADVKGRRVGECRAAA